MESSWVGLLVAALTAVSVVVKTLWPSETRGLEHRLKRTLEMLEKMPDGAGKTDLIGAAQKMARQLAWYEERRLRRRVDGGIVAAMLFVGALAGGITWLMWQAGGLWRVGGLIIAAFALILMLSGGAQLTKVEPSYRFERADKQPGQTAKRERAKA